LLMLIILNTHGTTALWVSNIASREMPIIWMYHTATHGLHKRLTRELFTLFVILMKLYRFLGLRAPFLFELNRNTRVRLTYLDFTIIQGRRYRVKDLLRVLPHTHYPSMTGMSMTVVQTFISSSEWNFVHIFRITI
jgi:hypothetical protein